MDKLNEMFAAMSDLIVCGKSASALVVGTKCKAKFVDPYSGSASFTDATIQKVNDDETFDIVFDENGKTRKNVPLNEIQIPNVSANV